MDMLTVETGEKMKKWKPLFTSEQMLDNINTENFYFLSLKNDSCIVIYKLGFEQ